ncbi:penicillin-binding protein [Myroides sp. JBRI-B21084]|uniref:penicillin-binding protein n=1 Tax=Myroides sp. JBRI-B21084 TaxID=3119977 RepID=UPI0026E335BD|nr:penicillin-binding protein [Paenimyroides cloacae]WKW46969.1 penicillin-binding protein [Paenimyroides cloacae]
MGIAKNENNRIYYVFFGMLTIGIAIFIKLSIIQFKEGEQWRSKADSLTIKDEIIPANRGNIYSADGSLLATSIPKYTIYFDPMAPSTENFEKYIEPFSDSLAHLLQKKSASAYKSYFRKARSNKKRYIHIATKLSYSQYMKLKSFPLFNLGKYKGGMIVNQVHVREYPMGMIANRTIGYERINDDRTITRKGIEAAFTDYLTGKEGRRKVQKMSKNLWKPIRDENEIEPKDGYDITTTIDVYIQDIAHHALLSSLQYYEADHGTVVVMETNTGQIKAISNLGKIGDGSYRETVNYAVLERHDPGSTFKLASYLALLDDEKADTATVYDTHNGIVMFSGRKVRDSNHRGYGKISLGKAFEVSSNTVVTQAVYKAYNKNPKAFTDKMKTFGFNATLGIDLKGEPKSYIPVPGDKNWSKIALPWMAYGYGILVTPLQTLTLYNAIANNGEMVKPQFVKEIRDVNKVIKTFDKEVLNPQIVKPKVVNEMQAVMKNVVIRGTGKGLYSPDFSMAGKTGTAQMNYGKSGGIYYASSFVGYFPAENPKYSCIVVIHRPTKHSYYGGDVAGPVFKRIAQKIFSDVPSLKEIKNIETPLKKASSSYKKYYANVKQSGNSMPNVLGLPAMDAVAILENLGLRVQTIGFGKVVKQSVTTGERIAKKQTIILELS